MNKDLFDKAGVKYPTNDWTHDLFEAQVPSRATFTELRLYINDSGGVFIRNVMMNKI